MYEAILHHSAEYGSVPTLATIKSDFPEYKFVRVEEPLDLLIDRLKENHTLALLEDGLSKSVEMFDERDAPAVMAALHTVLNQIAIDVPNTRDVDLTATGMERFAHYLALRDLPDGLRGIPTGFQTLDRATQGLQKEQLVTLIGPPKSGKSTLMLLVSMAAWLYGLRPLLFTFEMSTDEMTERLDAIRAGISHHRLRNGTLNKTEMDKLERFLNKIESMPSFWMSADSNSATTLSGISSKIDQYRPDIVFVDGVYMLEDEEGEAKGSSQALTNLTRGFKRMAQNKQLPLVISTQVLEWKMDKKKGVTSNSIGYSSSFAQDSDTIIAVERTDDDTIQKLKIVLSRNCPPLETYVQWDWENGMFEELTANPFEAEGGGWDGEGTRF